MEDSQIIIIPFCEMKNMENQSNGNLGLCWRSLDEHALKIDERKAQIAALQLEEAQDKEALGKIAEKVKELLEKI